MIEEQAGLVVVLAANRMRHDRSRVHAEHLREREDEEADVARDPHRSDGVGAEPSHPVQIDQEVQRLKDRGPRA